MNDEFDARIRLLGQIAILEDRIQTLKVRLVVLPLSDEVLSDEINDAIGNLSLQVGGLVGRLHLYQKAAGR